MIDARMVGPTLHGVARYVTLIAKGLAALNARSPLPYEPVFLVTPDQRARSAELAGFATIACRSPFLQLPELWEIPRVLKASGADLYHSPSFSSLLRSPCRSVITIHDLCHLQFGGFRERLYYRAVLRPFARHSAQVLTVSRFSQREISRWLGVDAEEIPVVYNAIEPALTRAPSEEEVRSVLGRYGLEPGRYFFCLSNPKPHKNTRLLIEAYERYRRDHHLKDPSPLVLSVPQAEEIPGVLGLHALREEEARALLAGAKALFFPSLYEGFGLPPVEAAALGVPLAVSSIPPHEEALADLRDSVHWVSPNDLKGWAGAFRLAEHGKLGEAPAEARARLLRRYEVERLGQDMDRIYRRVLGLQA